MSISNLHYIQAVAENERLFQVPLNNPSFNPPPPLSSTFYPLYPVNTNKTIQRHLTVRVKSPFIVALTLPTNIRFEHCNFFVKQQAW